MTGRRPPKDVAYWDQVKQFLRETETVVSYTWGVIQSPPMGGAIGSVPCTDPRGSSKWEVSGSDSSLKFIFQAAEIKTLKQRVSGAVKVYPFSVWEKRVYENTCYQSAKQSVPSVVKLS